MLSFNKSSLSTDSGPGPLLELGTGGQGDSRRPILGDLASTCIVSDALCRLFGPSSEGAVAGHGGARFGVRGEQTSAGVSNERVGGAINQSLGGAINR